MSKNHSILMEMAKTLGVSIKIQKSDTPPENSGRRRKNSAALPKYLDADELARLWAVLDEQGTVRDRAMFALGFHRGLRASEVGKLQMRDYKPRFRRLMVHRLKGSSSGEYVLTDREFKLLTAWLKVRGEQPGPIFLSRNNRAISRRQLDELAKKYMGAAAIDPTRTMWKTLRHSCCTALVDQDLDILAIADHVGHVSIASTQVYAKVRNKKRDELGEKLKRW